MLATLSLQPRETIAAAADKLKGRVSEWLREELGLKYLSYQTTRADIAIELMNSAQEEIRGALIPARVERLWQPSLYIGWSLS